MNAYATFLARKAVEFRPRGLTEIPPLNPTLLDYQREAVSSLLRAGCGAAFLDTGLGKTFVQAEWARVITEHTGRPVLILAPLAVSAQTVREGAKFGIPVTLCRTAADVSPGINITNYERLPEFDPKTFAGVVLDESSILKSYMGKTKRALCDAFAETPFRLCCTATPAPNDHVELGNHSEFLGIMPSGEMLTRWFINNTKAARNFRLKHHAIGPFWRWVASWAVCAERPSDLGGDDSGLVLPPLQLERHVIPVDIMTGRGDALFRIPDMSATALHREKRLVAVERAAYVARLVAAEPEETWLVWCDTDYEADALEAALGSGAVGLRGSEPPEVKEAKLLGFSEGRIRILVTKPSIAGFGLNWQHCARVAFAGVGYSYEAFYQAVRRCWRYGQKRPVIAHVVLAATEGALWDTLQRKHAGHQGMRREIARHADRSRAERHDMRVAYRPTVTADLPSWIGAPS